MAYHIVREAMAIKLIIIMHTLTKENLADVLTQFRSSRCSFLQTNTQSYYRKVEEDKEGLTMKEEKQNSGSPTLYNRYHKYTN